MTLAQAVIELFLLTIFLAVISAICIACKVPLDAALLALALGGISYILTVLNRVDSYNFTDKHLKK